MYGVNFTGYYTSVKLHYQICNRKQAEKNSRRRFNNSFATFSIWVVKVREGKYLLPEYYLDAKAPLRLRLLEKFSDLYSRSASAQVAVMWRESN
ncbi:hypothetical protein EVAR_75871_1 [Eumeta japonica]|uniref:Uncharacterized protein n=1 Tax=Eumeta variegata TaxID=151549 RepID=A0A4C1TEC7_EUMVA|nr:hypothetical protein EVAR_75871_1 [Eumeta japonica]